MKRNSMIPPSETWQLGQWPAEELERCSSCPVCGGKGRSVLFDALTDRSFFVAPGRWTLWSCATCHSAYLDPRPSEGSIGRAYRTYYTHDGVADSFSAPRARFAASSSQKVRNGYLNARYGYGLRPAIAMGSLGAWALGRVLPGKAHCAEAAFRHLPAGRESGSLLDVGCGNGAFLKIAKSLGYQASGLEPDPKAAAYGRNEGLDVRAGRLPGSNLPQGTFDEITLLHVLEHFHRPVEALKELWSLLRPGGRLWVKVPNLDSLGFQRFGRN